MEIFTEIRDSALLVSLSGELDHHSAAHVREVVDAAYLDSGAKHIIFCLERLSFMDSAGIGVIMGRYNKAKENGGIVFVTACGEYVKRILSMAGIFTIAQYRDTAEQALSCCALSGAAE